MDDAERKKHSEIMKSTLAKRNANLAADVGKRLQTKNALGQFETVHPPEVWDEILSRAAAGQTPKTITDEMGLSHGVIWSKIYADPEFTERFYNALNHGMLGVALETIDIADGGELSSGDYHRDKLMISTRQWVAERLNKRLANRPTIEAQQVVINLPDDWRDVQF